MDGAGYNGKQKGVDGAEEPLSDIDHIAHQASPTAQDGYPVPDREEVNDPSADMKHPRPTQPASDEVSRNEDRRASFSKKDQERPEYLGVSTLSIDDRIDAIEHALALEEARALSRDKIGNSPVEEVRDGNLSKTAAPIGIFDLLEDKPLLVQTIGPVLLRRKNGRPIHLTSSATRY